MVNTRTGRSRALRYCLVLLALASAAVLWAYRTPIAGYADVGTAYAAHVGCSCRHIGGRSLDDCKKDKVAGMELITMTEDTEQKSVTARFPLISSHTARFRKGYGCLIDR